MGANTFQVTSRGKDAKAAFQNAVVEARHEYGNAGYTGTIAEKKSFVMIECPSGTSPAAFANKLLDDCDPRVDDKWGPAGCIKVGESEYLFFGWASS